MARNEVAARRARAIALIASGTIHSQDDLVSGLKRSGYVVTQATASRDLEEVGAVRVRNSQGDLVYAMPSDHDEALARSLPVPADLIISVESSGNLAVIKTPPGGAQLLASSIDHIGLSGVIGTIAGDDTVLVVSKKASGGTQLAKELLSYQRKHLSTRTGAVRRGKKAK